MNIGSKPRNLLNHPCSRLLHQDIPSRSSSWIFFSVALDSALSRFPARVLLAFIFSSRQAVINLAARFTTPVYHGTPFSYFAAFFYRESRIQNVSRLSSVDPCVAPKALKSSSNDFSSVSSGGLGPVVRVLYHTSEYKFCTYGNSSSGYPGVHLWCSTAVRCRAQEHSYLYFKLVSSLCFTTFTIKNSPHSYV